jgi:cytochrome b
MFTAWQTARFSAFTKNLKDLEHYMKELRPQQPKCQTPEEMIQFLRALKESGVEMEIREVE